MAGLVSAACAWLIFPAGCGGSKSWKDALAEAASGITLGAEHGTVFYAFDTLGYPGTEVELKSRVFSAGELKHVKGAAVEYALAKESLGRAVTDGEGFAVLKWKIPEKPARTCQYEFTAKIVAVPDEDYEHMLKVSPAPLLVCARPKETKFAVIDLDHTVVASGFARVLIGGAKPMPKAAEVVKELARDYSVIYLTHRPDLLAAKSKRWLGENGFPRGPLLVSTLRQAFGDSGEYKAAKLKELRKQYPRLEIGIGDKLSDAKAYADNGLKAYLIPNYDQDDEKDMRELAGDLRKFKDDVQVVEGWEDVRAGVFKKKRFTPKVYAGKLEGRARQLAAERQRRKKEKDEDDDD